MKSRLFGFLVFCMSTIAAGADSGRHGLVFSAGLQPDFSYLLVSTSFEQDQYWYSQYFGGCSVDLRLGYSRTGKDVSSFVTDFTWRYPSGLFVYSLFCGYGYAHYMQQTAPCFLYGVDAGMSFTSTIGTDRSYPSIGTAARFKAGYELSRHWSVLLGIGVGGELRNYSVEKTGIEPNDLSNTIRDYGTQNATDWILNTSIGLSLSYSIF